MRILLIGLFFSLFTVAGVQAQNVPADGAERLTEALSLTAHQSELAVEILDERDAGSIWTLAAELAPTFSDAQKETLLAAPTGGRGGRAGQGGGQGRGGQQRARNAPDPATQAVVRAARDQALGLTPDQSSRFDALEASSSITGLGAGSPETLAAEMANILTPEQQELVAIHGAISRSMRGRRGSR